MDRRLPEEHGPAPQVLDGDHIAEDALELYSLGRLAEESDLEVLEGHLLICGFCQTRLDRMDEFTKAAKVASKAVAERPGRGISRGILSIAIAACLMLFFWMPPKDLNPGDPVPVNLVAVRDTAQVSAPSGKNLQLELDKTGISAGNLDWELASSSGEVVNRGGLDAAATTVSVGKLPAGRYWVRLKSCGTGEVLREFSLLVQ